MVLRVDASPGVESAADGGLATRSLKSLMIIDGGAPGSSICWRSRKISFTPASLIARWTKSGDAAESIGTTTAPRNRIPQKQATHSAELGPQRRTRSPGTTPRPASAALHKRAEA